MLHTNSGHMGQDRTVDLVQQRYFWIGLVRDVKSFISKCLPCLCRKGPINHIAPLVPFSSTQPLELICIDFLTLDKSKGGFEKLLVMTDHFTRYAQAIPCKNECAKTTAKALFHHFINHYGFPLKIHSDQGRNFESNIIAELYKLTNTQKSRSIPFHPIGNSQVERFNRTLLNMLGTLNPDQKEDWKTHISTIVHAYNCTRNDATGYSPFYLMYGRHPRLPIDLIIGLESNENSVVDYHSFVDSLKLKLAKAYEITVTSSEQNKTRKKNIYDKKVRGATIQVGDRVLVRNLNLRGRHKLANLYESSIYIVVNQVDPKIPVFTICKQGTKGPKRTLHRSLLLPVNNLPLDFSIKDRHTKKKYKAADSDSSSRKYSPSSSSESLTSDSDSDIDIPTQVKLVQPKKDQILSDTADDWEILELSNDNHISSADSNSSSISDDSAHTTVAENVSSHEQTPISPFSPTHISPTPPTSPVNIRPRRNVVKPSRYRRDSWST